MLARLHGLTFCKAQTPDATQTFYVQKMNMNRKIRHLANGAITAVIGR